MISYTSIWAVVLRYLYLYYRDPNPLLAVLYWPLLDVLIWGFLGSWIQRQSLATQFHNYELIALMGILLWQVIGRGCNIILFSLLEEIWSNNVVNLFSLPLRLSEWISGVIIFTLLMICVTTGVCTLVILALYDVSAWNLLHTFLIFAPPLLFASICLGFITLQILFLLGKRGMELGFIIAWFFLPFSGAYYPIDVLPPWGQTISSYLPMSYVFQGMRAYLMHQQDPSPYLMKGYLLGIVYLIVAFTLLNYGFRYSKKKGLARLTD